MEDNTITYETTPTIVPQGRVAESWKSESINELATALAKAQLEIDGAGKNTANDWFKSSYADLYAVINASMPHLSKNGISIVQGTDCPNDTDVVINTILCHSSGQWIKSSIRVPLKEGYNAQDLGAACTYGRRYGLSAMVGIAQVDDDANSISPSNKPKKKKEVKATPKKTESVKTMSVEDLSKPNTTNNIMNLD